MRRSLSIAVFAVVLSACGSAAPLVTPSPSEPARPSPSEPARSSPSEPARPSPSEPVASPPSSGPGDADALTEPEWSLIRLEGIDIPPTAGITIRFGPGGDLGGSGGCNEYGGRYSLDGDSMAVEDVVSTLIGCEGVVGQREGAFFAALAAVETWLVADDRLTLSGADGSELMVFEAAGTEP